MFQTSYKGIVTLHNNKTFKGGFCQFFYIPIEDVEVFPRINGDTQMLVDEPLLITGKKWYGPIRVPKDKLGFTETMKVSKAGPWYEIKATGMHVGDSVDSRINLENMPYHRYLVAGKVRFGGFYVLLNSSLETWCRFLQEFNSGSGPGSAAGTQFSFITEQITKALIMPEFEADTSAPDDGGNGEGEAGSMPNQKEIIPFSATPSIAIPWTSTRQSKFGNFPIVEVYLQEEDDVPRLLIGGTIEADNPPPAFSELTVNIGGSPSGFIVIS